MALALSAACVAGAVSNAAARAFTTADAVGMIRFVNPSPVMGKHGGHPLMAAPDGARFAAVWCRGNLQTGVNEYSLVSFSARDIRSYLDAQRGERPLMETLARFDTAAIAHNRIPVVYHGIDQVHWIRGGAALAFIGRRADGIGQVYTLDVQTRDLRQLTRHPRNILSFEYAPASGTVVFVAEEYADWSKRNAHGYILGSEPDHLLTHNPIEAVGEIRLFAQDTNTGRATPIHLPTGKVAAFSVGSIAISPSARWAVAELGVPRLPRSWTAYEFVQRQLMVDAAQAVPGTPLPQAVVSHAATGGDLHFMQYFLIDLSNGDARPLLDAPAADRHGSIVWRDDSGSVMVSDAMLPFGDVTDRAEIERRAKIRVIAEVDIASGATTQVASSFERHTEPSRSESRRQPLSFTANGALIQETRSSSAGINVVRRTYIRQGKTWTPGSAEPLDAVADTLDVRLTQDIKTPVEVLARDSASGRQRVITDLHPQLRTVRIAPQQDVQWTDRSGHEARAGLILPLDYVPVRPYPAVIYTYGYRPYEFQHDAGSIFAPHALASRGVVSLRSDCFTRPFASKVEGSENPLAMACIEDLIDEFARRGIVDRKRIGLLGFSHSGLHALYTLAFSEHTIAAAALADASTGTLSDYTNLFGAHGMRGYDTPVLSDGRGGIIAGPLFGKGIDLWLQRSPLFHLERVRAPIFYIHNGTAGQPPFYDAFVILKRAEQPVEMMHQPLEGHSAETPWGVFASLQTNVDWFAFWLREEERTTPIPGAPETNESLRTQYERWRVLRDQQRAAAATPRPPIRRWQALN